MGQQLAIICDSGCLGLSPGCLHPVWKGHKQHQKLCAAIDVVWHRSNQHALIKCRDWKGIIWNLKKWKNVLTLQPFRGCIYIQSCGSLYKCTLLCGLTKHWTLHRMRYIWAISIIYYMSIPLMLFDAESDFLINRTFLWLT